MKLMDIVIKGFALFGAAFIGYGYYDIQTKTETLFAEGEKFILEEQKDREYRHRQDRLLSEMNQDVLETLSEDVFKYKVTR